MVLYFNLICVPKDGHKHRFRWSIFGIINTANTRHNPDEILMPEMFPHQLSHNTQTTDLNLNCPILNIIFHGGNQNRSLAGGTSAKCRSALEKPGLICKAHQGTGHLSFLE